MVWDVFVIRVRFGWWCRNGVVVVVVVERWVRRLSTPPSAARVVCVRMCVCMDRLESQFAPDGYIPSFLPCSGPCRPRARGARSPAPGRAAGGGPAGHAWCKFYAGGGVGLLVLVLGREEATAQAMIGRSRRRRLAAALELPVLPWGSCVGWRKDDETSGGGSIGQIGNQSR